MTDFKKGDRVQGTFYGEPWAGTVAKDSRGGIVFVVRDGKTTEDWFHVESVTKVEERA